MIGCRIGFEFLADDLMAGAMEGRMDGWMDGIR
jgi:hypothetical protein